MSNTPQAAPRRVGVHFDGDLRGALVQAAVEALDEHGADQVSLRDVARRAGVSHAAPAHHFGDKPGLLTAVATQGFDLFTAGLGAALAATADAGPVDQFAALGRAYAAFAEQRPGHFEVMFRPALIRTDDPDYGRASGRAFAALHDQIAACQRRGWRADADTASLAAAAWAFAHGLATLRLTGSLTRHFPDPTLDGVSTLVTTLINDH